jgi:hypothetical protein
MSAKKRSSSRNVEIERPPRRGNSLLILVLVIAMGLSAVYLFMKGAPDRSKAEPAQTQAVQNETAQEEPESVIDCVKRHIIVNEDEEPYVRSISNIDLLRARNPNFYKDAERGDKVLIWSDKAVIYSERLDKIVAVATAVSSSSGNATSTDALFNEGEESGETEQTEFEHATVEIRNGSRVAGAASRLKTKLVGEDIEVLLIGDAANLYEGSRIIDRTGGRADSVIQKIIAAAEGAILTDMPQGEPESEADILVIIGR